MEHTLIEFRPLISTPSVKRDSPLDQSMNTRIYCFKNYFLRYYNDFDNGFYRLGIPYEYTKYR